MDGPPRTRAERYAAITAVRDHDAEAAAILALLERLRPATGSLLDVGCGPGRHLAALERLAPGMRLMGIDLDPEMVALAAPRLRSASVGVADMMDMNVEGSFDAVVCLFGTIALTLTVDAMRRAIAAMAAHLHPAGVLLVEPYHEPWRWRDGEVRADTAEGEGWVLARVQRGASGEDGAAVLEECWLLGTGDGIETIDDSLRVGLFSFADIRDAFRSAGLRHLYDPAALRGGALHAGILGADV
jgi:SAM-dependent methyltransferase